MMWRRSAIGSLVGAVITVSMIVTGRVLDDGLWVLLVIGVVSTPVAIGVGWWYGPQIRDIAPAQAFDLALRMAVFAVAWSAILVGGLLTLDAALRDGIVAAVGALAATVVGVVVLGLPAFAIAFTAIATWAVIMRILPTALVGERPMPAAA
jgi:hypothetical protein